MSAIEKRIQDLARFAFSKIAEIASSTKASDAARALSAIQKIVAAVQSGFSRKISPAELARAIEHEQKTLAEQLSKNKETILSELDKKFPA